MTLLGDLIGNPALGCDCVNRPARFVKVYRSDKLCGNDHSHKVCGNAVEKLAVPTNVAGMLAVMHALFL